MDSKIERGYETDHPCHSWLGKENYFYKQRFIPENERQIRKQISLSKISFLQNNSNPAYCIVKQLSEKGYLSNKISNIATNVRRQNLVGAKLDGGFYVQNEKKFGSATLKCKNKSLSIQKSPINNVKSLRSQQFSQTFGRNSKLAIKKSNDKPRKYNLNIFEFATEIESKLEAIFKIAEDDTITNRKAQKEALRILKTAKLVILKEPFQWRNILVWEFNDFLTRKIKETEKILSYQKIQTESKGTVTTPSKFDVHTFITILKSFSLEFLQQGQKTEFNLATLVKYFENQGHFFEELDFETQKLLKSFYDTMQKQLIFEEIAKVFDEQNIKIENYLKTNYQKAVYRLIAKTKQQMANYETLEDGKHEIRNNPRLFVDNNVHSKNKDNRKQRFTLDLKSLVKDKQYHITPHGFHQEFIGMTTEFSKSWRDQIEKEKRKFGFK